MAFVLRALSALAAAIPWRWLRAAGAVVGWIAGSVLRVRRTHVESAMRAAGLRDVRVRTNAMYRSLGTSAVELLHLAGRGVAVGGQARIDEDSRERWSSALGRGRGVVVAASHTGNWDLAACAIARDVELLVVTKHLSVRSIDAFWQSMRASRGVGLASPEGALQRAAAVLARGGAVAMMIDQVPASRKHAIEAEFLGRRACVDRAPAVLAASRGAPLVVTASRREADGVHVLTVLDVIEPPPRRSMEWAVHATRAATRALEGFVRRHPDQWLWLHRRWKRLDPDDLGSTLRGPCPNPPTRSCSPAAASRAA